MAAITLQAWARIVAKGIKDPKFRVKLEVDPLAAVRQFKQEFLDFPAYDALYDLNYFDPDNPNMFQDFRNLSEAQLQDIVDGTKLRPVENSKLKCDPPLQT